MTRLKIEIASLHPAWRGKQRLARRVLAAAAASEGASGAVSLLLADDARLAQLNRDWRGKPSPTNVLSFPAPAGEQGEIGRAHV